MHTSTRRIRLSSAAIAWVVFGALVGGTAYAEPYIAIRTGLKCSTCHVNQTGGGKRTDYGLIYTQTRLPMWMIKSPDGTGLIDTYLNKSISVGANVRVAEKLNLSSGGRGPIVESSNVTEFTEANLYVQIDLIPERVMLYSDQTLAPSTSSRELWTMIQSPKYNAYVKAGRILLPYGLRIIDNDAFIRNRTGYNYSNSANGLELGWDPGPITLVGNVTDDNFSAVGSVVYRRFQVGGSFGTSTAHSDDVAAGPFAGVNFGKFTVFGEVDFITKGAIDQLATLVEVNYLAMQGLNFKATYEFFDRNRDLSSDRDGRERLTMGAEPFIAQFVQLRAFYRINRFIPQNGPENQDQAILELQVFF